MAVNEAYPFYEPGSDITGHCDAAVTGKRFVKINADRQSNIQEVSDATGGGNVRIVMCVAGDRSFGVAAHDSAIGNKVAVKRGPGKVMPVRAGAAIAAFQEVQSDASGQAIPLAAGRALGFVLTAAVINTDAQVQLY